MKEKILSLTKKNKKVLLFLVIIIFLLTTVLSFAYLSAIISPVTKTEISGTGSDLETLTFSVSNDVNFVLDGNTFGLDAENVVSTITSTITATAADSETFSEYYYAYINLENEFVYSTTEETPEIILTIIDENDNEITEIDELTYYSDLSGYNMETGGFDITTNNGIINIFTQEISTTSTEIDNWTFIITLIAHTFDQSINEGANFNAEIYYR